MRELDIGDAATVQAAGYPPLVLLPGMLCDARVFAPLRAELRTGPALVLPITGGETATAVAHAILACAPPRFVLAGFSLGGIVALEIAAIAPDRIMGLAFIASTARAMQAGSAPARRAEVALARAGGMAALVRELLWPRYVTDAADTDTDLYRLVVDMAEALGVEAFRTQTEIAIGRTDSRQRLRDFRKPVLAICGEQDAVCTPEMHREIAAAAPDSELCVVPGAAHFVLLEAPGQVAARMQAWLDRLSGPVYETNEELP